MMDDIKGIHSTEEGAKDSKAALIRYNPNVEDCSPLVIKSVIVDLTQLHSGRC